MRRSWGIFAKSELHVWHLTSWVEHRAAPGRDISTTRSYSRYAEPLPRLTLGPRAQKGVTGESLNKRRRLDIKNCSSREKRWLYCAAADANRQNVSPKKMRVTCQLCRCGVTQEEIQPALGFTSPIPERDAFLSRGRNIFALLVASSILLLSGTKS